MARDVKDKAADRISRTSLRVMKRLSLGASITMSVSSSAPPPLVFQWFKDGLPVIGATNATVTSTNVQTDMSGQHYVTVANPAGTATGASTGVPSFLAPDGPARAESEFGAPCALSWWHRQVALLQNQPATLFISSPGAGARLRYLGVYAE